jgi:hypothetical protein
MDHKESVSLFISLKESIGYSIGITVHTPNSRNPTDTNLNTSHGSLQRLDRDLGQD